MAPQAVRYIDGQRLDLAMLNDEQAYLQGLHARHARRQHGPGLVSGLGLTLEAGNRLTVAPGMAIDHTGRDLLLAGPLTFDLPATADDRLDLRLSAGEHPPLAQIDLLPATDEQADAGILLGRLARREGAWHRLAEPAPQHSHLIGQHLHDPSHRTRICFTPACDREAPPVYLLADGVMSLEIHEHSIAVPGLQVDDGKPLSLDRGLDLAPAGSVPTHPRPWHLQAMPAAETSGQDESDQDGGGQDGSGQEGNGQEGNRQDGGGPALRLELPQDGRLSIGRSSPSGFQPLLTVSADGEAIVHGNLQVAGSVSQAPLPASSNEPRFLAALADAWQRGTAMADTGSDTPLKLAFENLTFDLSDNRLTGQLVLLNNGETALRNVSAILTAHGTGFLKQSRLSFPRRLIFLPPNRDLAGHAHRTMPVTLTLPDTLRHPDKTSPLELVAVAAFNLPDGASGRTTAVSPVTLPAGRQQGEGTSP